MISLITALFGGLMGIAPEIMKYFKNKQDQKHELDVMRLQIENTKMLGSQRLDELFIQRDIGEAEAVYAFAAPPKASGNKYIDGIVYLLNCLVRPLVAFWLFGAYVGNKMSWINVPWNEFDQGMLAGVASFYFTNRAMRYALNQLQK